MQKYTFKPLEMVKWSQRIGGLLMGLLKPWEIPYPHTKIYVQTLKNGHLHSYTEVYVQTLKNNEMVPAE